MLREAGRSGGVGTRRVWPLYQGLVAGAFALTLTGCNLGTGFGSGFGDGPRTSRASFEMPRNVPAGSINTVARQAAADGLKALDDGRLEDASRHFNMALKLEISRSELQFLNGLTYHMMALQGDETRYQLAEEGYKLALKFDPSNWVAQYFLGLAYLDQRKYMLAQAALVRTAIRRPDDPHVLYDLARAAYYAQDPRTADAALRGLKEIAPDYAASPRVLRALSVTKAALNQGEDARRYLADYQKAAGPGPASRALQRRIAAWQTSYETAANGNGDSAARVQLAQFTNNLNDSQPAPGAFPQIPVTPAPLGAPGATPVSSFGSSPGSAFASSDMVVVDVVLIGIEEDRRESRGVNLLNGLQLQFGDPLTNTPGLSWGRNYTRDMTDDSNSDRTRSVTRLIGIPSVTYSLNIANSLSNRSEILAKPSLVALSGQTSEFFSGVDVAAAAVSGGQGDSVSIQKEVGVKLKVTPEFLPNDMVRLQVVAERTFLTDPSNSVLFQFRLDTTKTQLNATVAMKFGETLILGGLSERENSGSSDGVPVLKDLPLTNLFFSRDTKRQFERSILILLTPRRPHYGARSPEGRREDQEKLTEFERSLEAFERRHRNWFIPRQTFNEVIERLERGDFADEFRTGDIESESWLRRQEMKDKVGEMVDQIFAG